MTFVFSQLLNLFVVERAIRMLQLADLQVVCVVADGVSPNRRLFRLHKMEEYMKSGVTYNVRNVCHSSGDSTYFVPDVPNLIKTSVMLGTIHSTKGLVILWWVNFYRVVCLLCKCLF